MNINKKVADALARANKATCGPWDTLKDTWKSGVPVHRIGSDATGGDVALTYRYEEATEDRQGARDAEFIAHARFDVPDFAHAIDAVLELHVPQFSRSFDANGEPDQYCDHCNTEYPCPTIRALDKGFRRSAVYALMDFDRENGITE